MMISPVKLHDPWRQSTGYRKSIKVRNICWKVGFELGVKVNEYPKAYPSKMSLKFIYNFLNNYSDRHTHRQTNQQIKAKITSLEEVTKKANVLTRCVARWHVQLDAVYDGHRAKRKAFWMQNHNKLVAFCHIWCDSRPPKSQLLSKRLDTSKHQSLFVIVIGWNGIHQFHLKVR